MKNLSTVLAVAFIGLILPFLAVAQAAPTATLSWTGPTSYTDGTAITQAITYNVYQGTSASTLTKVASGVTSQTQTITTGLSDGTTYFWSVTAVVAGVEGPQATPVSKTFSAGTPSSVVSLTVK